MFSTIRDYFRLMTLSRYGCKCLEAESLRPDYVCPLGHTY